MLAAFRQVFGACRTGSGGRGCLAHQIHRKIGGLWVPPLLTVDGDAVLQLGIFIIVALEMDLVGRVVRAADDSEVGELITSPRRRLCCLACRRVQSGLGATECDGVQIREAEFLGRGCAAACSLFPWRCWSLFLWRCRCLRTGFRLRCRRSLRRYDGLRCARRRRCGTAGGQHGCREHQELLHRRLQRDWR